MTARTINGLDLVSTSIKFFDCTTHFECTSVSRHSFHVVEAHTAENCRNDVVVAEVSVSIFKLSYIYFYNYRTENRECSYHRPIYCTDAICLPFQHIRKLRNQCEQDLGDTLYCSCSG